MHTLFIRNINLQSNLLKMVEYVLTSFHMYNLINLNLSHKVLWVRYDVFLSVYILNLEGYKCKSGKFLQCHYTTLI